MFFSQRLGLSLGLFYFYRYVSVPYFVLACDTQKFVSLPRVLDRGHNGF